MYSKSVKLLFVFIVTAMILAGICMPGFAQGDLSWEVSSIDQGKTGIVGESTEFVQYNGYLYIVNAFKTRYMQIFKINNDGTTTDVTPNIADIPELYFEFGNDDESNQINNTACRNIFISGSNLYLMMQENTGSNPMNLGFIRQFDLSENPELPKFVCDYYTVINDNPSTYIIRNAGVINGELQAINIMNEAYKFTLANSTQGGSVSYPKATAGDLKVIPYYIHTFEENGNHHTFLIDRKSNLYYIDHSHPTAEGNEWSEPIIQNVRIAYYHKGHLYIMNNSSELVAYRVDFDSDSENRTMLSEIFCAGPSSDSVLSLSSFDNVDINYDVEPIIWNDYMLIAGNKGIAAVDISDPLKPKLEGIILTKESTNNRIIATYNDFLFTISKERAPAMLEIIKLSLNKSIPTATAQFDGNSASVSVTNADNDEVFMAILASYDKNEDDIDTLADCDYKEITGNGAVTLTIDNPGKSLVAYVWKKDLTPIAKFIK